MRNTIDIEKLKDYEMDPFRHYYPQLLSWEYDLISKGWKYIGAGRHRRVIGKGNVVIKIPFQPGGKDANQDEYTLYSKNGNNPDPKTGVRYAPCRLLDNGCLMMRRIEHISYKECPLWAKDMLDGAQVGIDKNGTIMAYDYSCELRERFEAHFNGSGSPSHRST